MNLLKRLPQFDSKSDNLNVVIDTPKGCRSKFAFRVIGGHAKVSHDEEVDAYLILVSSLPGRTESSDWKRSRQRVKALQSAAPRTARSKRSQAISNEAIPSMEMPNYAYG